VSRHTIKTFDILSSLTRVSPSLEQVQRFAGAMAK